MVQLRAFVMYKEFSLEQRAIKQEWGCNWVDGYPLFENLVEKLPSAVAVLLCSPECQLALLTIKFCS